MMEALLSFRCKSKHVSSSGYSVLQCFSHHSCAIGIILLSHVVAFLSLTGLTMAQMNDNSATLMLPAEKEAFYEVVEALNPQWDWRSMYADPCGANALQGTSCDLWGGYWYFTTLSFGPVYDNTLPCAQNASIHPSISKLTHLKSLSFYNCFTNENRTIPVELAQLSDSLEVLTFRKNSALVGGIPAALGGMWKLQRLVMTGNNLEGTLPIELGELSALVQLDLSHNMLQGAVPEFVGVLSNLVVLDLSSNSLSGRIPQNFATAQKLEKLDISRNMLEGAVPESIGSLKSLKLLDLSYNNLQGKLPASLDQLTDLQELYLCNNELSGIIPDIWSNFTKLISLDLSASAYEGLIPPSFGALKNVRYLSVRNNRLTGAIPRSLGDLPRIYSLYLNHNNLSGPIPFTESYVQKLGSNLVLDSNEGLCSLTSMEGVGVSNMKVCYGDVQATPHLSSATTFRPSFTNGAVLACREFWLNNLLLSVVVIIFSGL